MTELIDATERGDINGVMQHVDRASTQTAGWQTTLMYISYFNNIDYVHPLLYEAAVQILSDWGPYGLGTTTFIIAAAAGRDSIIERLVSYELGNFYSNNNCALFLTVQYGHYKCSLLLLSKACNFNINSMLCLIKLRKFYQRKLDTEGIFVACYEHIRDSLMNMVFLQIRDNFSTHLLASLLSHDVYQRITCMFPRFLELLWTAILGESEEAFDELDNYNYELEESHIENLYVTCLSCQPDCVLLPCIDLVICSSCVNMSYAVESIGKCPFVKL